MRRRHPKKKHIFFLTKWNEWNRIAVEKRHRTRKKNHHTHSESLFLFCHHKRIHSKRIISTSNERHRHCVIVNSTPCLEHSTPWNRSFIQCPYIRIWRNHRNLFQLAVCFSSVLHQSIKTVFNELLGNKYYKTHQNQNIA